MDPLGVAVCQPGGEAVWLEGGHSSYPANTVLLSLFGQDLLQPHLHILEFSHGVSSMDSC